MQIMPIADAVADAAQFVQAQREDVFGPINYALLAAMIGGAYAIEPPEDDPCPEPEYHHAKAAAHYAFAACPGLRDNFTGEGA